MQTIPTDRLKNHSSIALRVQSHASRHWKTYAAATGAALAGCSNASAAIIYHSLNLTVSNSTTNVNVDGLGAFSARDFTEAAIFKGDSLGAVSHLGFALSSRGNAAQKFSLGAQITTGFGLGNGAITVRVGANHSKGNFTSGQTGFVGFNVGGDLGWVRIVFAENPDSLTVIDYAYNNVAGQAITAGEGIPSSSPEPGTMALALLAAGAAGVTALRRRNRATTAL